MVWTLQDIMRQRLVKGFNSTSVLFEMQYQVISALLRLESEFFNCLTSPRFHYLFGQWSKCQ